MSEKILASAAGLERAPAGSVVTARVDLAMANDMTAPLAFRQFHDAGATRVFEPERVCVVAGRHAGGRVALVFARRKASATSMATARAWTTR